MDVLNGARKWITEIEGDVANKIQISHNTINLQIELEKFAKY